MPLAATRAQKTVGRAVRCAIIAGPIPLANVSAKRDMTKPVEFGDPA